MTTYSITLDDVDLALLPRRTYTNDFLRKELFQFQVMRTETTGEPSATVHYDCHICAIQVPAAFASEHAASIKHRANARIASVAVERTRGLIAALPPPHVERSNRSYCPNCSLIVGRDHNRSKQHRIAVNEDKMLWELMTVYVGDDNDDDDKNSDDSESKLTDLEDLTVSEKMNEVTEIADTKAHNKQFKTDVLNCVLPKRRKRSRPKNRGKTQLMEVEAVKHANGIDNQAGIQNHDGNKVDEIDHSNTNCYVTNLEIQAQTICEIDHLTDTKKYDSQSISTPGEDLTLNNKREISDTNELEEIGDEAHNSSVNIFYNIQLKEVGHKDVQNKEHYKVDESDDSSKNSEVTSETQINYEPCHLTDTNSNASDLELRNEVPAIIDSSYHKALEDIDDYNDTSETHEEFDDSTKLNKEEVDINNQADIKDNADKDSKIDDVSTNTELTVSGIEKINSKIRYTIDACNKIRNDMELNERVPIETGTTKLGEDNVYEDFVPDGKRFVKRLSDHYHDFTVKLGKVECKKCNRAFNCDEQLSHVFSTKHTYPPMIEGLLFPSFVKKPVTEDSSVRKLSETYSQCYICHNVLRNKNVATHILTTRHQNKLKEAASAKDDRQDFTIADTDEQHAENTGEQYENAAKEAENKTNTTVRNGHNFEMNFEQMCKAVEQFFLNKSTTEAVETNVKKKADTTAKGNSGVDDKAEPKPGPSGLKLTIKYPYEATDKESVVRCVVCDCLVPNAEENRKGHLGGSNHAVHVGMNKPSFPYVATNQEGFVRCVICNYNVPNDTQKRKGHLYGTAHANKVKNKEISYPYEATKQDSVLRCVVCNCKVPNTPENKKNHMLGSRHSSNVKAKKGRTN